MPYSISSAIAAGTTNATLVSANARTLSGWYLYNAAAYTVWLKVYDAAVAPTAGSGTPVLRIGVPAGGAANVDLGTGRMGGGVQFTNGIAYTITKLGADNDTTVVVAADLVVNLFYS